MDDKKPNHICRVCFKEFWACPDCDKRFSWRAVACSPEHYQQYIQDVIDSRSNSTIASNANIDEVNDKKDLKTEVVKQPSPKKIKK